MRTTSARLSLFIVMASLAVSALVCTAPADPPTAGKPPPSLDNVTASLPRDTVDIGTLLLTSRVEIRSAQRAAVEGRIADETGHLARAYSSVGSVLSVLGAEYDDGDEIARQRQRLLNAR